MENNKKNNNKSKALTVKDEMSDFLLYTSPEGNVKVEAILSDETVWLSQEQMALLFGVQKAPISKHLKNIFDSGELIQNSVVSILETTVSDGKKYQVIDRRKL